VVVAATLRAEGMFYRGLAWGLLFNGVLWIGILELARSLFLI
jgi:hypothetical protein